MSASIRVPLSSSAAHNGQTTHSTSGDAPRPSPVECGLGDVAQAQDKLDEALKHYDDSLRIDPHSLSAHINRGVVFGKQGRLKEAVNAFRTVLESAPDHTGARQNLAFALELLGRTNDARLVMIGKLPPAAATEN